MSCTPLYHGDDLQHFDWTKIEKSKVPRVKTMQIIHENLHQILDKRLLIMVMVCTKFILFVEK